MLEDEGLRDEFSVSGQRFRRRFGVPHEIFLQIVKKARKWFPKKDCDAFRRPAIPIQLKVLASLRVLSKGWNFDGIAELSFMHESTMQSWHHLFVSKFVLEECLNWIQYPKTAEEAAPILSVFQRLGFPGAIGSTDCTHISWGRCPAGLQSAFCGKSGYATIAFEVTVDHHGKCLWVSDGHPGLI